MTDFNILLDISELFCIARMTMIVNLDGIGVNVRDRVGGDEVVKVKAAGGGGEAEKDDNIKNCLSKTASIHHQTSKNLNRSIQTISLLHKPSSR